MPLTRANMTRRPTLALALLAALAIAAGSGLLSPVARPPDSSASPAVSEPGLPITASFYYGWYPSHWTQDGVFPYTNYSPSLGLYSSADETVLQTQIELAEQAHIEAFISSWWERNEGNDATLQQALAVTESVRSPVRWAVYYEPEGWGNPSVAQIVDDLGYLTRTAFSSPSYLRVDGKPVVFVFSQAPEGCEMVDRWLTSEQNTGTDLYIALKTFDGYEACSRQPDSWHAYNPSLPLVHAMPHSVTISPGFWRANDSVTLARDPSTFDYVARMMSLSGADWQLVSTWNEWLEGTSVEPALEYGTTYLDILCKALPGPAPCASASTPPASTPTPSPNPTSTPGPTLEPDPSSPTLAPAGTSSTPPEATPTSRRKRSNAHCRDHAGLFQVWELQAQFHSACA